MILTLFAAEAANFNSGQRLLHTILHLSVEKKASGENLRWPFETVETPLRGLTTNFCGLSVWNFNSQQLLLHTFYHRAVEKNSGGFSWIRR